MTYVRARFHADVSDYRPVKWPPLGPYWCTGYGHNYSVVVAYLPAKGWRKALKEHWPEASRIEHDEAAEITFSSRFQKPDWWKAELDESELAVVTPEEAK